MTLLQHLAIIFNLTVELNSQSDKLLAALHNNIHYYVYCLYALFKDKMVELNGSRYFLYPLLCVCVSLSVSVWQDCGVWSTWSQQSWCHLFPGSHHLLGLPHVLHQGQEIKHD